MAKSKTLTLQISDIIQWYRNKELIINETFQRYSVWTPQAKTYLIDTILHELPIPKMFLRTILDPNRQTSIREIVDGQQRIRAIVEFADNKLRLSKRSADFYGLNYSDLDDEQKQAFLGYTLTIEHLLNATDDDVIDIFARLNSYTVTLNAAEKRHAEFQTDFKFAVRRAAESYRSVLEKYRIFTTTQRFRMADDELLAELFGLVLQGVTDGGAPRLRKLYKEQDDDTFTESVHKAILTKLSSVFEFIDNTAPELLAGPLCKHYQLLMIAAAILHHKFGIPSGQIDAMPPRKALASRDAIMTELGKLERTFGQDSPPKKYKRFIEASASSTQRIASRKTRFLYFAAMLGEQTAT
jgi:hypothetical protein